MRKVRNSRHASLAGIIGLVALAPSHAAAQDAAEGFDGAPIVVSAQRREEASLDVPITVTTLSEAQLATANVDELIDISKVTPSLRFDFQGAFVQPNIRGIGTAVTSSGGGANVGIYVDGFYSPNPLAANFQLMKIRSIQVLKGPQGTLFGRNTTGGAILVQSAEPSTDTSGEMKVSYGRYNEIRGQAYATVGLSEKVALDLEGLYRRGDGWIRDIADGSKDGGYESWSVRLGLKAELSDSTSVLIRYMHSDVDDPTPIMVNAYVDPVLGATVANFAPPGSFTTRPNEYSPGANPRYFRSNSDVLQATIKSDLGFADLASYSQYRQEDIDASQDGDRIALTIFQLGFPVHNKTWSQEFLLTSKPGGPLQWTAGLFYFSNKDRYVTFLDNNRATVGRVRLGGSSTTTQSYAAFADATYEVTPQLFLTAGLRYARDTVTDAYYNPQGSNGAKQFVPDLKSNKVTPRLAIRYKPSEEASIYASYTKGYKAGVIDVGGSTGNTVKPEKVDAFEAGFKFDDRRLSLEAAAFYYDYRNLQVSLFKNATAQLVNAASSEIYGLEMQMRYRITNRFEVNLGGGWTHARYKRFEDAPIYVRCPTPAGCGGGTSFFIQATPLRNVTMQRVPEFTGNIGANYRTDLAGGELAVSGNFYYTSKFFHGPSGIQFPEKGYEVVSLRAQWTDPSERYTVALWGDNVTDSRYHTSVQYGNFGIGSTWSKPATYGVELGVKF